MYKKTAQQFGKSSSSQQVQNVKNLLAYANDKRKIGLFNDVSVKVGQRQFPASRLVLSCYSHYFEKMFTTAMKERYEDIVQVEGVSEVSMKILIEFIYTRKLDLNDENALEVTAAVDYLQIDEAKQLCFDFLSSMISTKNCLKMVKMASMFSSKTLAEQTNQFFSKNFSQISQQTDFKNLSKTELEFCLSNLHRHSVEESSVYEAIIKWIKEKEVRQEYLIELMRLLDLNKISSQFLDDVVLNENLIAENLQCSNMVMKVLLNQMKNKAPSCSTSQILSIGGHKDPRKVILISNQKSQQCFPCLPKENNYCRALKVQNYIYCVGGYGYLRQYCLKLDSDKLCWESIASLDDHRPFASAAVFRDKIVIAGGCYYGNSTDCYDYLLDKWISLAPLNQSRELRSELVAYNGCLYVLGGGTEHNPCLSSVEMLSNLAGKWKVVQPMQTPRVNFAAVNYRNAVYAIGGSTAGDHNSSKSVERFDAGSRKWTYVSNLNVGRRSHAACVMQDKIFVVGGLNKEGKAVKEIECYDLSLNQWTVLGKTEVELYEHTIVAI